MQANASNAVLLLKAVFKMRKDGRWEASLWLRFAFLLKLCCLQRFSSFKTMQHTKIGDWWNLWFFLRKNYQRAMWEGRWKENLYDALKADTFLGLLTLGTDAYGSKGQDTALLKTIYIHMTPGKFSCSPIHRDCCSI